MSAPCSISSASGTDAAPRQEDLHGSTFPYATTRRCAPLKTDARATSKPILLERCDLESSVFTQSSPRKVALSLKRSAERSRRRKGTPYQSAMSTLTFYINRAGKGLP